MVIMMADNIDLEAINAALRAGEECMKNIELSSTTDKKNYKVFFGRRWVMCVEECGPVGCSVVAMDRLSSNVYKNVSTEEVAGLKYADVVQHCIDNHGYKVSFVRIEGEMILIDGLYSKAEHRYVGGVKKYAMRPATSAETHVSAIDIISFVQRNSGRRTRKKIVVARA